MAGRMGSVVASGVVALLAVAIGAAPAAAAPPEREHFEGEFEAVLNECDGFDIVATGSFSGHVSVFTADDGTMRIMQQFAFASEYTRSDTGAVVATAFGHEVLLAPLDGMLTSTYMGMRITETYADGTVLREIGRIDFDGDGNPIFLAGPHPFGTVGVDRCDYVVP